MSEKNVHEKRREIIRYFSGKESLEKNSGAENITFTPKMKHIQGSDRAESKIYIRTKGGIDFNVEKIIVGDLMVEISNKTMDILLGIDEVTQYAVDKIMTSFGIEVVSGLKNEE